GGNRRCDRASSGRSVICLPPTSWPRLPVECQRSHNDRFSEEIEYNHSGMIATKTPTVEEFLRSGDNDRSEYARGEKWEKPLPNKDHASLQASLGSALVQYGRQSGI